MRQPSPRSCRSISPAGTAPGTKLSCSLRSMLCSLLGRGRHVEREAQADQQVAFDTAVAGQRAELDAVAEADARCALEQRRDRALHADAHADRQEAGGLVAARGVVDGLVLDQRLHRQREVEIEAAPTDLALARGRGAEAPVAAEAVAEVQRV